MSGAFNFRDLGGYASSLGGQVKTGLLFRSDDLFRLNQADLELISQMGIRLVIDLRTLLERERGTFLRHNHSASYQHLPLMDVSARVGQRVVGERYLQERYREILTDGAPQFVRVFEQLSKSDNLPAVFHCAVGKDRTGLIAMLCLGLLGVSYQDIVADYVLTSHAVKEMIDWLRREQPELARAVEALPQVVMGAHEDTMSDTLKWIDDTFGSLYGYARYIGIEKAAIDNFRDELLSR